MKRYNWLLLLIILSVIPLLPLFHPGLPITHDGKDHVARIANFFQNLSEGILIPRWAGNLNWGYGHPILMFLYPLPSYAASLFRLFGFSFIDSTKLVFGFSYIASGVSMYLWLRAFLKKGPAFFGSVLYLFSSYRFVDLYVRGAIGEHVAFIFPPLVCYCLYRIIATKSYNFISIGGLALAGLILSHNAISLMFLPFIVLYGLYLTYFEKEKKKQLIASSCMIALGFLLSAFFWIPAFFEGKYTLRDIVSTTDYTSRLYPLSKFIFSPWSFGISGQFSLQIGLVHWLIVIIAAAIVLFYRKRLSRTSMLLITLCLLFFIGALFLMIPSSLPVWSHISLLQKFQFPWRFLSVSVFTTAVLGALVLDLVPEKIQRLSSLSISLIAVLLTIPFWHANGYLVKSDNFFSGVYAGTTDTGESSPLWSVRFMESTPRQPVEIIGGQGNIHDYVRRATSRTYKVEAKTDTQIRENTLYFPGWHVFVDGKEVPPQFQDTNNRGVITYRVGEGLHDVAVVFRETRLRFIANIISALSLLATGVLFILMRSPLWKRFR